MTLTLLFLQEFLLYIKFGHCLAMDPKPRAGRSFSPVYDSMCYM